MSLMQPALVGLTFTPGAPQDQACPLGAAGEGPDLKPPSSQQS